MRINGTDIENYLPQGNTLGRLKRISKYCGVFNCPDKALHGCVFTQVSTTKATEDESGTPIWGDTVSEFSLLDSIPFPTLGELIDFYNKGTQMKDLKLGKITLSISECGTVIMQGEKRKNIRVHKLKSQRTMYEVNAGDRTYNVRRLVALAWLKRPRDYKKKRVLLKDNDEHNLHYTNLYYSTNSHTPEEATELKKHLKQYQNKKN